MSGQRSLASRLYAGLGRVTWGVLKRKLDERRRGGERARWPRHPSSGRPSPRTLFAGDLALSQLWAFIVFPLLGALLTAGLNRIVFDESRW